MIASLTTFQIILFLFFFLVLVFFNVFFFNHNSYKKALVIKRNSSSLFLSIIISIYLIFFCVNNIENYNVNSSIQNYVILILLAFCFLTFVTIYLWLFVYVKNPKCFIVINNLNQYDIDKNSNEYLNELINLEKRISNLNIIIKKLDKLDDKVIYRKTIIKRKSEEYKFIFEFIKQNHKFSPDSLTIFRNDESGYLFVYAEDYHYEGISFNNLFFSINDKIMYVGYCGLYAFKDYFFIAENEANNYLIKSKFIKISDELKTEYDYFYKYSELNLISFPNFLFNMLFEFLPLRQGYIIPNNNHTKFIYLVIGISKLLLFGSFLNLILKK